MHITLDALEIVILFYSITFVMLGTLYLHLYVLKPSKKQGNAEKKINVGKWKLNIKTQKEKRK